MVISNSPHCVFSLMHAGKLLPSLNDIYQQFKENGWIAKRHKDRMSMQALPSAAKELLDRFCSQHGTTMVKEYQQRCRKRQLTDDTPLQKFKKIKKTTKKKKKKDMEAIVKQEPEEENIDFKCHEDFPALYADRILESPQHEVSPLRLEPIPSNRSGDECCPMEQMGITGVAEFIQAKCDHDFLPFYPYCDEADLEWIENVWSN